MVADVNKFNHLVIVTYFTGSLRQFILTLNICLLGFGSWLS